MENKKLIAVAAFACFMFSACALLSQEQPKSSTNDRVINPERHIPISVGGDPAASAGFSATDLQVRLNGKLITPRELIRVGRPQLGYCVLFDTSNSERTELAFNQNLAAEILARILKPAKDTGWLILFGSTARVSTETDDPQNIIKAIKATRASGGTSLYDAIGACSKHISAHESSVRAMFLFSDGDDNQSHIGKEQALEMALAAGVRIYAIDPQTVQGFFTGMSPHGSAIMKMLAEKSGGRAFYPVGKKDPAKIADEIDTDLENVFLLTIDDPTKRAGLEIKANQKGTSILAPKEIVPRGLD